MIFAAFYTRLSQETLKVIQRKLPALKNHAEKRFPDEINQEISLCFHSVQKTHPAARCILLTDQKTKLNLPKNIEIHRFDLIPNDPVYMRLTAQIQFLQTIQSKEAIIFCDYDMLFQHSLEPIFNSSFDIAFTYRRFYQKKLHREPLNGGVIMIHPGSIKNAYRFLITIQNYYLTHYSTKNEWGGDQASINGCIGFERIHAAFPDLLVVEDIRIKLLPESEYNFPIPFRSQLIDYYPDKYIIHFKGPRKPLMKEYWKNYLS